MAMTVVDAGRGRSHCGFEGRLTSEMRNATFPNRGVARRIQ